jgi:chemotaxis protein CheD
MILDSPLVVKDIYLNPGEFSFGLSHYRIRTLLGSCVALILWHPEKKLGGMSHVILPSQKVEYSVDTKLPGKFADESMELFKKNAKLHRTDIKDYVAKIFGGAHLMSKSDPDSVYVSEEERNILEKSKSRFNIGERNSIFIKELLDKEGIKLVSEHIGGYRHRKVFLTNWDGEVWMENPK